MANALALHRDDEIFMPIMALEAAIERRNAVVRFTQQIMKEGTDYGKIPGAGDKPTLLKPGAEKLSTFFGLTPMFIPVGVVEDWTGDDHKGEPFFYYRYRCELHRNGVLVSSSEGSCNTWESKYRYRKGERLCPNCSKPAIKKSKFPPKNKPNALPGWYCYSKADGCGAEFDANDTRIVDQEVGRIINPDVADQVNTVQKMAQKRALIAATLLAVNASEFYTQDIEDMVIEGEWSEVVEPKKAEAAPKQGSQKAQPQQQQQQAAQKPVDSQPQTQAQGNGAKQELVSPERAKLLDQLGEQFYQAEWNEQRVKLVQYISKGAASALENLLSREAEQLIKGIEEKIAANMSVSHQAANVQSTGEKMAA